MLKFHVFSIVYFLVSYNVGHSDLNSFLIFKIKECKVKRDPRLEISELGSIDLKIKLFMA
jgi:hypothetical protein